MMTYFVETIVLLWKLSPNSKHLGLTNELSTYGWISHFRDLI